MTTMTDFINRQDAINAIVNELDAIDHVPQWVFDRLTKCLEKVPSAEQMQNAVFEVKP